MHRPAGDTLFAGCLDEGIEQTEAIYLGLQVVIEHGLEGGHLGVHNHDIGGDASLTEGNTLVGHCHCEVVNTMILQGFSYLDSACSIGIGLDHAHHLGFGLHERAIEVEILDHGIEIDLEDGFVNLLLELLGNLIETERTGTLQENHLVAQTTKGIATQEVVYIGKELLVGNLDFIGLGSELGADTNKLGDATLNSQLGYLSVEFFGRKTRLEHIAEDKRTLTQLRVDS